MTVPKIITIAARKGGVGKTTIAYELAYVLGAPLVDLEFSNGSATRAWGYRHESRVGSPLLDAIESGEAPRLINGAKKPPLVPGHPDFEANQPDPEMMRDLLIEWAEQWGSESVVVDIPGGATPAGYGAIAAASTVLVPSPLATKELNALEEMIRDMADYPLVVVPNMIPRVPRAVEIKRLSELVEDTSVGVATPIPFVKGIGTRMKRVAITSEAPTPRAYIEFVEAIRSLADGIREGRWISGR